VKKVFFLLTFSFLILTTTSHAQGPYALLELGGTLISQQDAIDAMTVQGFNSPGYTSSGLGSGSITGGYSAPGMPAIEISAETFGDRDYSYTYSSGGVSYGQLGLTSTGGNTYQVSIGPVLSSESGKFLFLRQTLNEIGAKIGYASSTFTETVKNLSTGQTGSADAMGSAYSGSVFYRLRGRPFKRTLVNLGFEIGYEYLKIPSLVISNSRGTLAGSDGQQAKNANGNNSYIDNSGPYLKLIFGFGRTGAPLVSKDVSTDETLK
jgi:hypothetical protein